MIQIGLATISKYLKAKPTKGTTAGSYVLTQIPTVVVSLSIMRAGQGSVPERNCCQLTVVGRRTHGGMIHSFGVYDSVSFVEKKWFGSSRTPLLQVCVVCVFFPSILDIKFVGHTSRGHTGGRSHRSFNPPSFCGACLDFCREKDSAIPFPRRP